MPLKMVHFLENYLFQVPPLCHLDLFASCPLQSQPERQFRIPQVLVNSCFQKCSKFHICCNVLSVLNGLEFYQTFSKLKSI